MKIQTEKQEMPDQKKSMEVVVVGGGVSGISIAWTQAKLGHNDHISSDAYLVTFRNNIKYVGLKISIKKW